MPRAKQTRAQKYAENVCRGFRAYIANNDAEQFHIAVAWVIKWIGRAGKDKYKPAPKPRGYDRERAEREG